MLVSLPWALGVFRRDSHRPAAYLNILLTLLAFIHGSLVLRDVMAGGRLDVGRLDVGRLDLERFELLDIALDVF